MRNRPLPGADAERRWGREGWERGPGPGDPDGPGHTAVGIVHVRSSRAQRGRFSGKQKPLRREPAADEQSTDT